MTAETSVVSDLSDYVNGIAKLLRLDAALLSIETKQSLVSIAVTLSLFAAALVFAILGLIILLSAIVLILVQSGLSPAFAALGVGVALFVAAGLSVLIGVRRLGGWSLVPRRTVLQFQANIEALRAGFRHEPRPNR